jgi:GDPmannose 4,6-dehydratase
MKNAVVTGISGQDAAYLAELLLNKGYAVFGTYRAASDRDFWRIDELGISNHENLHFIQFDATSLESCKNLLDRSQAAEVYNLAGQTSAVTAIAEPLLTAEANGMATVYLLEAIRKYSRRTRFFQAGSSELFGEATEVPQVETTSFSPTNPYGVAKLFAHWSVVNYREAFGLFATSGILFNHESPFRGLEFVTRKITDAFAKMSLGKLDVLELGNIEAKRDWAYAKDFVLGMWTALQTDKSDTFIFATNRMHTVRDFINLAGRAAGYELIWKGTGEREVGLDIHSGKILVRINPKLYRPIEIHQRLGDPAKAYRELGWRAVTTLPEICKIMVDADIRRNQAGHAFACR